MTVSGKETPANSVPAAAVIRSLTGALGGSGTVGSLGNPEVNKFSGTVIFVENRTALKRSASQLEDIKVIVEF